MKTLKTLIQDALRESVSDQVREREARATRGTRSRARARRLMSARSQLTQELQAAEERIVAIARDRNDLLGALHDICSELPKKPQLPLVIKIAEIARGAVAAHEARVALSKCSTLTKDKLAQVLRARLEHLAKDMPLGYQGVLELEAEAIEQVVNDWPLENLAQRRAETVRSHKQVDASASAIAPRLSSKSRRKKS